ncbi:inorganic phosphate transporter [Dysgonomonas sp. 511]|uniref:inorganic phosphate transporter n=1 Tax=Dysgonomonas sp. 511 TaxID=2302930 RepID=UPI0013D6F0DC|nr:inorganic phosphate transporter [Dysgonomonas sp. 511]NDV77541.1 inorganic phosphate transporter [Dysgonomonas sp. 511]
MTLLITIIVLAIIFDFINGFHDAANSIATVVSTKVLTPTQAVIWAAFFNFVAYFIAKLILKDFGVAKTISDTIELNAFKDSMPLVSVVLVAALTAAIIWNLITWRLGIPSSSSHTLIGGLAGGAIAACGFSAIHSGTIALIVAFIVLAPVIGMVGGNLITLLVMHLAKKMKPAKAERWFKNLQLVSSAGLSIGHGLNDSQKVMGVIAVALVVNQHLENLPKWMKGSDATYMMNNHEWIALACFGAIALGTICGGWKIMKTMGNRITKITPIEGFCAQTAGALTLFVTEKLHVPVSTTHVITGSIIGVGSIKRLSAVRWGVTKDLLVAWVLTIPVSAIMAMLCYYVLELIIE